MCDSKKNSSIIILSSVISKFGNIVFDYANQTYITSLFNNRPIFLALYQSMDYIVNILVGLYAGVLADNKNRKKILVIGDLFSALVCAVITLFLAKKEVYISFLIGNAGLAVLSSIKLPAYNAIVKDSVLPKDINIHWANFTFTKELVAIISPIVGISMFKSGGMYLIYYFNIISFILSAMLTSKLKILNFDTTSIDRNTLLKMGVIYNIKIGMVYILEQRSVFRIICLGGGINLFLSMYSLLLPYLNIFTNYKNSVNIYGYILSAQSVGALLVSLIEKRIKISDENKLIFTSILLGVTIMSIPLFKSTTSLVFNLFPYLFIGGELAIFNINFYSFIQKRISSDFTGRVHSIVLVLSAFAIPFGSIVGSIILDVNNINSFYYIGLGIFLVSLIYIGDRR